MFICMKINMSCTIFFKIFFKQWKSTCFTVADDVLDDDDIAVEIVAQLKKIKTYYRLLKKF